MEKLTHSKALAFVLENCDIPQEIVDDLTKLKRSIDHKNATGSKVLTKTQKENIGIKADILGVLSDTPMTATDVGNAVGVSMNKASALLNQMVKSGEVVKDTDGKKSVFTIA